VNPEKFLNSLVNYEKIPGYNYKLKDYKEFLTKLDAPQNKLKNIIHVAGTKGKGSTATIINSCLIANGYKVGLYTSPHLENINERIKINNQNITNHDLVKYLRQIRPHIKQKNSARTFFEVLTTIAFLHFIDSKTDFSVLEVGLGGRLDATNVTNPLISVITKIGYDHIHLLGSKLSQIAFEKAGIIKKGINLITIHQRPSVEKILKKIAVIKKTSLIFAEDQHQIDIISESIKGSYVRIKGALGKFNAFLPLVGQHQLQNLLLALAVLNELKKMGYKIDPQAVKIGISQTKLHGRFEIISKNPLIIYDCAHNQDSFEALNRNLKLLKTNNFFLIFGFNKYKNVGYCLRNIFPKAKEIVLVQANNPLSINPLDIYDLAKRYQKNLIIASSVKGAIEYLKTKADKNTAIIITGSFYLWPGIRVN